MPTDPNARRDKALETIAREFGKMNDILAKIDRHLRQTQPPNPPYLESSNVGVTPATKPFENTRTDPYGAGPADPYPGH